MMANLLGYHLVDGIYDDANVAKNMAHLRVTRPAWINVLGGSQYREALEFAKLVRREIPETRVIFRHFKNGSDNGMHTRLTADEWWSKIGSLYIGSDLTILTDNESGSADLTYYSDWHARAMTLAAQHGVSLAYGRWSTHNPQAKQWPQLDSMWRAGDHFWSLHIYSPNVYFSDTNFDGIEHIFGAWRRCADIGVKSPNTVIGEYAYCYQLDPHKGYRYVNMPGRNYVTRLIQRGSPLWSAGIPACIYSIGEWPVSEDSFSLDDDAQKALEERVISTPPPPTSLPPIPLSTDPRWSGDNGKYIAQASGTVKSFIRAEPKTTAVDIGSLPPAIPTKVRHIPHDALTEAERKYQFDGKYNWYVLMLPGGKVGYSREDVTKVTIEPPPVIYPTLPPTTDPRWIETRARTTVLDTYIYAYPSEDSDRLLTLEANAFITAKRLPPDATFYAWFGLIVGDAVGWVRVGRVKTSDIAEPPAPPVGDFMTKAQVELLIDIALNKHDVYVEALIKREVVAALAAFRAEMATAYAGKGDTQEAAMAKAG